MKDLIKKSMLLGLGAASLTREKISGLIKEFVKRKAITAKDGKLLAGQVLKEAGRYKSRIGKIGMKHAAALRQKAKSLEKHIMKRGRKAASSIIKKVRKS